MDKIIKKFLIILVLALNANIEVIAAEPETVTFQGAVNRHVSSDKSVEVSGVIQFYYDVASGQEYAIDHTFTIPAGQRSVAYSKTLSWDLPGSLSNDPERRYFSVEVQCLSNCEEANVTDNVIFAGDEFGKDERDDAYIVNFDLDLSYILIDATVTLPNQQIADEDIPFQFIFLKPYAYGYDPYLNIYSFDHTIKQGQSEVDISAKVDIDTLTLGTSSNDKFTIGYHCASLACERSGLLDEGWLGSDEGDFYTEQFSSSYISFEENSEDDDFSLKLTKPIEMFSRDKPVDIAINTVKSIDVAISGRIIVEEVAEKFYCYFGINGVRDDKIINFQEDSVCAEPLRRLYRNVLSSSEFRLDANELTKSVSINTHTLKNKLNPTAVNGYELDFLRSTYQTIRFECDSGCDNTSLPKIAYLTDSGKFSARYEGGAKRFYQTEEFLEGELLLNLVSPPLITPMLDLLMEEEASD